MQLYNIRERTGFCIYSENGTDHGKFINALRNSPIQFYGLTVRGDKLYGYVRTMDYRRLCSLAYEHKLKTEQVARKGLFYVTRGYHMRFGLIIGFLLSLGMLKFLSDRVMIIEIDGNETIPDSQIISLLRDSGIYIGSKISDVDLRSAERQIKGMDKDVGWIGIRNTGSRVVVEISEFTEPPEIERKSTPCNIVAARDAQIKDVKIYSGMLVPMIGEGVKKGDIIVSGVVDTNYGRSYYVHSIGDITGIYTEKMTFSEKYETEERVYTGEREKRAVSIFGRRFTYSSDGDIEGEYEYYEEEKPLTLGKITFPLAKVIMHYRLTDNVAVKRTEEETAAVIKERIARYEENFLSDNVTITDKKIARSDDGSSLTLTVTYTVEGEIGQEQQIFAKYEAFDDSSRDKKENEQEEQAD